MYIVQMELKFTGLW